MRRSVPFLCPVQLEEPQHAIDCEFLGLPSAINECASSLFDTPSDRYKKLRDAVCRFPPCQLGLVCYQEGDEGATYRADAFCITLFKRIPPKEFSISTPAVNFLAEHKFDFNKFVSYGVNYCNHRELADLKSQITTGNIDLELLGTDFEDRMRLIKMRILLEIEERGVSDCHSSVSKTATQLRRPLIINLYHGEVEDFDQGDAVWDRPVSPLEEAVMLYSLYEEYPDLEFQLDCERTLLYVGKQPLMFGRIATSNRGQVLDNILTEISGVSQIFQHLSVWKPPLIGHNCLLDLMYIYNCFEDDLPESYCMWKMRLHEKFPFVIDTKFLAESLGEALCTHGVTDFSLTTLANFFNLNGREKSHGQKNGTCSTAAKKKTSEMKQSISEALPLSISLNINGVRTQSLFKVQGDYHNAAFDAIVTGVVFVALAHVYVVIRCSDVDDKPRSLWRLLISCREEVANKIPISMIDARFCNMEGEDLSGSRPGTVEVRLRRQLMTSASPLDSVVENLRQWLSGLPQVSPRDSQLLKDELVRLFGAYRVDVRMSSNKRSLEIATNSPSTYARVCSFFDASDRYCFVHNKPQTFEQRLCSSRARKETITKNSSLRSRRLVAVILLSIALPSVTLLAVRFIRGRTSAQFHKFS
uniref:Poly(A)-specific ribonuclease n=1 Tax=Haemonchus contortus TaxID=6289 RepID=A0A7I4YY32_HAECO